jgi:hypothetical protein
MFLLKEALAGGNNGVWGTGLIYEEVLVPLWERASLHTDFHSCE